MIDITRERPLSVKRVAAIFEVHSRTVERWFSLGLERVKFGGKVYTTKAALQRFAQHDTVVAPYVRADKSELAEAEAFLDSIGV